MKGGFSLHSASEPMRAQPPGPTGISAQQTASAQPCRAQAEMKRLVGICSWMEGRILFLSLQSSGDKDGGVRGVGVCYREIFSSVCKSISVTSADPVASVQ